MKKQLRIMLSLLCTLCLVFGCLPLAQAEEDVYRIVQVEWMDENDYDGLRPESVTVSLGGKSVSLSADKGWAGEIAAAADAEWLAPKVEGYAVTIDEGDVTVITCRHGVTKTSVSVNVVWEDWNNAKGVRPNFVSARLLADGAVYGAARKINRGNKWKMTWKDLPVTRKGSSEKIVYTVDFFDVPSYYALTMSDNTATFTVQTGTLKLRNSVEGAPEGADLSKIKILLDGPDPAVHNVTLTYGQLADGTYDFGDVLVGAYLAREIPVDLREEGYILDGAQSATQDAVQIKAGETETLTLSNVYTNVLPELPEEEEFDPYEHIGDLTFEILGPDDRMPMTVTYAQFTDGKYELKDLTPGVYVVVERNAGTLVDAYTLTAESVTGMAVTVSEHGTATVKLYNRYAPVPTPEPEAEYVNIPVNKIWNDNYDADGNRPESITVRLYADGVEVDSHVLTVSEGWAYTFMDKPRYQEDGKTEIKYTVREDEIPMYTQEVTGTDITNHYTPSETSASVSKVWNDSNNAQGLRPSSIAMMLYNSLGELVTIVILDESNGWTATVNHLPTVVQGQKVTYAWQEQHVLGYTLESVEQQGSGMIFTNSAWTRPETPTDVKKPKTPGQTFYVFEDYDTPLGVGVMINHVGDCFD